MLLKNNAKRLISINSPHTPIKDVEGKGVIDVVWGKVYELLPAGEAVAVPDELCKTKYVKALIKCGDVVIADMTETPPEDEDDGLYAMTVKELQMKAFESGIEVPSNARKDDIIAAIREFESVE